MRKRLLHKCSRHTKIKEPKTQTFVKKLSCFLFYVLNLVKNNSIYREEYSIEILRIHQLIYE